MKASFRNASCLAYGSLCLGLLLDPAIAGGQPSEADAPRSPAASEMTSETAEEVEFGSAVTEMRHRLSQSSRGFSEVLTERLYGNAFTVQVENPTPIDVHYAIDREWGWEHITLRPGSSREHTLYINGLPIAPPRFRIFFDNSMSDGFQRGGASPISGNTYVFRVRGNGLKLTRQLTASDSTVEAAEPDVAASNTVGLAELHDSAFEEYVDLRLLGRAINEADAALMADVALQLAHAERVLRRPHSVLPAEEMLRLAAKLAARKNDAATLERLSKAAERYGKKELGQQIAAARKLAGQSRSTSLALAVAVKNLTPEQYTKYWVLVRQLLTASLTGDEARIAQLREKLPSLDFLSDEQGKVLQRRLEDGHANAANIDDGTTKVLTRLASRSRGGIFGDLIDTPELIEKADPTNDDSVWKDAWEDTRDDLLEADTFAEFAQALEKELNPYKKESVFRDVLRRVDQARLEATPAWIKRLAPRGDYKTNKFDKMREVTQGGWEVAFAHDISERDVAEGVVAAGVSIYSGGAAFAVWVDRLLQRTWRSLSQNARQRFPRAVRTRARQLAMSAIRKALQGEIPTSVFKRFDTLDFKAGAIRYVGGNYVVYRGKEYLVTPHTWGIKPYVAFRWRGSGVPQNSNTVPSDADRDDNVTDPYATQYVLTRFRNRTSRPIRFTFQWSPVRESKTKTLGPGDYWYFWLREPSDRFWRYYAQADYPRARFAIGGGSETIGGLTVSNGGFTVQQVAVDVLETAGREPRWNDTYMSRDYVNVFRERGGRVKLVKESFGTVGH